jgi:MFS family permease
MATSAPPSVSPPVAVSDAPAPRGLATFRALRHFNYRLYFSGQLISLTGSWVQTTALTWLAYELTNQSSRWPALIMTAQVIPTLLLGVWGGSLADRWPRRSLIFITQSLLLLTALILAGLVYLDAITPLDLLAVSLVIGIVTAIDTPARLAFVIDMVGREDLANAIALNSLLFNVARAVGPPIGGFLLSHVGAGSCFLINGYTFVAVLVALPLMRLRPQQTVRHDGPHGTMVDAFRFLVGHRQLVLLLILAGALAFFGWPLLSLLPALADQQLHPADRSDAAVYTSILLGAVGVGALIGALVVATLSTRRRGLLLTLGVVLGSVSLLTLAVTDSLTLASVGCALAGGGLILFFATSQAAMQLGCADHNRGRIMGIWLMVLSGAHPAGHMLSGFLADLYGVAPILVGQAAGIAVAGVVIGTLARWTPAQR